MGRHAPSSTITALSFVVPSEKAFVASAGWPPDPRARVERHLRCSHPARQYHDAINLDRYVLAREWCHPGGPVSFNPQAGGTQVTVARLPPTKPNAPGSVHVVFNVGNALLVHEYDARRVVAAAGGKKEKDPVKPQDPQRVLSFPGTFVTCHAYRPASHGPTNPEAPDLLIGLANGEVISTSLRALVAEGAGVKLGSSAAKALPAGSRRFNTDGGGGVGGSAAAARDKEMTSWDARCNAVAWNPNGGGFISLHADGNVYAYDATRDASVDPRFPRLTGDLSKPSVTPSRTEGSNPFARWHLSSMPLTCAAFTAGGKRVAVSGADGLCRVLDVSNWERPAIAGGFKSYYGGLNFCSWAAEERYLLAGGEADMIEVFGTAERAVVAWAEGHASWVTHAAEDPAAWPTGGCGHGHDHDIHDTMDGETDGGRLGGGMSALNDLLDEIEPMDTLRFGSVGQDCVVCLYDMAAEGTSGVGAMASEAMAIEATPAGAIGVPGMPLPPPPAECEPLDAASSPVPPPFSLPELRPSTEPLSSSSMMSSPIGMMRSASKQMLSGMSSLPTSPAKERKAAASVGGEAETGRRNSGEFSGRRSSGDGGSRRDSLDVDPPLGGEPDGPSIFDLVGPGKLMKPAVARAEVTRLNPVMVHKLHPEPCTHVVFTDEGMLTCCAAGVVKLWLRPAAGAK